MQRLLQVARMGAELRYAEVVPGRHLQQVGVFVLGEAIHEKHGVLVRWIITICPTPATPSIKILEASQSIFSGKVRYLPSEVAAHVPGYPAYSLAKEREEIQKVMLLDVGHLYGGQHQLN